MTNHNSISQVLQLMKAKIPVDRPSWKLTGWRYTCLICAKYFFQFSWYTLIVYAIYKLIF